MEKTLAEIKANIAALRAHVAQYRQLAEARKAADQSRIAAKLMELVVEPGGRPLRLKP
jgi:phage shock protein A